jgi:hypothetical protein
VIRVKTRQREWWSWVALMLLVISIPLGLGGCIEDPHYTTAPMYEVQR